MGRGENKHEKVPANLRGEAVFRVHSMGRDQKVLPKIRWATCFYFEDFEEPIKFSFFPPANLRGTEILPSESPGNENV